MSSVSNEDEVSMSEEAGDDASSTTSTSQSVEAKPEAEKVSQQQNSAASKVIDNVPQIEEKRFKLEGVAKNSSTHPVFVMLFMGPPQGGKSFQLKKQLIDAVHPASSGESLFDKVYIIANRATWNEYRIGLAAQEYVATGKKSDFNTIVRMFEPTGSQLCIDEINSDHARTLRENNGNDNLRKLLIADDSFSINQTAAGRQNFLDLAQQSQHKNCCMYLMVHNSTQQQAVALRKAATHIAYCNEDMHTTSTLIHEDMMSKPMQTYRASAQMNPSKKKFLLQDKREGKFYDCFYLLI